MATPAEITARTKQRTAAISGRERRSVEASRLMARYYDIPQFRLIPAEDQRAVSAALNRARDMAAYTGLRQKQALILDRETDPLVKVWAYRVMTSPSKLSNPERRIFKLQHPELLSFYSSLSAEAAEQVIGVASVRGRMRACGRR